jgi:hypothetical protein
VTGPDLRSAVAAAAATLLGAAALFPVFTSAAWLRPVLAVVLAVLAGGLLLRVGGAALWSALPHGRVASGRSSALGAALVPFGQLLLVLAVLTALFAPAEAIVGVIPTPSSTEQLLTILVNGAAEIREQATPALPLTGLLALVAVVVGVLAVLVDLVSVGGRQATLAGLALLVLFCIPVATITGTIGLAAFAGPTAGAALLMWTDQRRRLATSGRVPRRAGVLGGLAAVRTGTVAVATGLVLGSFIPILAEGSLATGLGGGSGGGATGTSLDPVATMAGQLTLPEPIDLLRLDASVDDPGYLRALAIDEYDTESGWTLSNMRGELSISGTDDLAPLPAGQSYRPVTATVEVLEHDDRFLPTLFAPQSIRLDADGWRFDSETSTVYGREVTSGGLAYTVTAAEPRPTLAQLGEAEQLGPDDPLQRFFTALPVLDQRVIDLVAQVTAGSETPYDRVRRIQEFLTDRSQGFIYSLATEAGTSGDDLVDFLTLRRGYCEQYAGAMAVMVRAAGVPARVALGYTPGTAQPDGSRLITSDDAHAWVEVYFDDLGWVPFDPTPIAQDRAVELPWAPRTGEEERTESQAEVPTLPLPEEMMPSTLDRAAGGVPAVQSGEEGGPLPWWFAGGTALALLACAVAGSPAAVRTMQRRRRVASGSTAALWDELMATALDVGVRSDPAWTPRRTARELGGLLPPDSPGADAVLRLALAEEAASYGPPTAPGVHSDLPVALTTARRTLLAAVPRSARLRARVWPASLVRGAWSRLTAAVAARMPRSIRRARAA